MEGQIEVRLFAYLRDGKGQRLYLEEKTVRSILKTLKIESDEVSILLIRDGLFRYSLEAMKVINEEIKVVAVAQMLGEDTAEIHLKKMDVEET